MVFVKCTRCCGWSLALLAVFLWAESAQGEEFTGTVTSVAAGHVMTVQHGKVRELVTLYAIQGADTSTKEGKNARSFTSGRVLKKEVRVQVIERKPRVVYGHVRLSNGQDLGGLLVKNGLASWKEDLALSMAPQTPEALALEPLDAAAARESLIPEQYIPAEPRTLVLKGDPAAMDAARRLFRERQEAITRQREAEEAAALSDEIAQAEQEMAEPQLMENSLPEAVQDANNLPMNQEEAIPAPSGEEQMQVLPQEPPVENVEPTTDDMPVDESAPPDEPGR